MQSRFFFFRRSLYLSIIFFWSLVAASQELPLYYGQDFLSRYQEKSLKGPELKDALFKVLTAGHVKRENQPDTLISTGCRSAQVENGSRCIEHRSLGYDQARKKIFGHLYLEELPNYKYGVTDVYCERLFTDADFNNQLTFGPDLKPESGHIINTEHTWPQSRFGGVNRELQKADIHHLFPTDSQINAVRSSLRFGNVEDDIETLKCPGNRIGHQADGGIVFQPPARHRGNVARAILYFATRYKLRISPPEESALRQWHVDDPVDEAEYKRNSEIEHLQGNRNPYIDFPDLVSQLSPFQ